MKGKTVWICVLVVIALIDISSLSAVAQTIKWSPPDKSFTVEVPLELKESNVYPGVKSYGAKTEKYGFMIMMLKNIKLLLQK